MDIIKWVFHGYLVFLPMGYSVEPMRISFSSMWFHGFMGYDCEFHAVQII